MSSLYSVDDILLPDDSVHVWWAACDRPESEIQHLEQTLSSEEIRRAGRYYFKPDRIRFVVGRGLLRYFLSRYLDAEPAQICFKYGRYGKPEATRIPGCETIRFSLSYARDMVLFAFGRHQALGIDIETLCPVPEAGAIADGFFTSNECSKFFQVPEAQRETVFFRIWTRKEALIKAMGGTLAMLEYFDVPAGPLPSFSPLAVKGGNQWYVIDIRIGKQYQCALVTAADHPPDLVCRVFK